MSNTNIHRLFATPKVKAHSSNRQTKPARKKVNRSMLPLLVKVANAEDEATSDGWDVFHYRKFLNRKGIIQIPRDKACNVKEVIQQLVSKNADIRFGDPETEGVVTRAVEAPPKEHWLYARHLGWRPNRKAYVLQNRVIGSSTARLKVKPSRWVTDRQLSTVGQAGDLANWQKRIAAVSRYSTRIMLLMSAAWAAPLLEIIKLQPFSINLFGRAKSGKTTALLAATSIIGIGTESQLPNWNTTDSAFQETARMFNDSIVPLNEIGLLKGGKKDAYPRLRQLTYWFSEGRDTTRNSGSAYAVPTDSAIWRGIAISTAENSIDDLAVLSQQQREYGELARAHDVPAVKAGYSTVFDRFPKSLPSNKRRAWARKQLRLIRMAAESNHGQAIDPVILEIIRLGSEAEKYVSKCMKEFRLALGTLPRDGALRYAVDNFSCIYAGGCFAIKAGVVPWTREKLRDAIADCFQGFLKTVHQQQNVPANAKRILLKKLSDLRLPLKRKGGALPSEPTEGFVQKTSKGTKYAIKTPVFADWFPDKKNEIAALTWLDSTEKLLKKADAGTSSKNREWAVTFPKWNASKGMRAIQFYDPRPN